MEPGLDHVNRELAQIAIRIAADLGAAWVAILFGNHLDSTAANTASTASTARLVEAVGADTPEDMASAVVSWLQSNNAGVLLAPSTTYGREVAARVGAATSSGVAGDAIGIGVSDGSVFALKPALGGSLVAEICFKSPLRIVTVRPGAMPASRMARSALADASSGMTPSAAAPSQMPATGTGEPMIERVAAAVRQRVTVSQQVREVDIGKVLSAGRLVCIGAGVDPSLYKLLDPLVELLGAQQVATRKVTDKGHLPRALQVGITGINVSPDLYLAIGVQGKPNHMAGVHGAGTVVSMNIDPDAVVFGQSDIGMVGDWQELVPALHDALKGFIRRLPPN
jgi:electron transfer flavoprotein alpha subunit